MFLCICAVCIKRKLMKSFQFNLAARDLLEVRRRKLILWQMFFKLKVTTPSSYRFWTILNFPMTCSEKKTRLTGTVCKNMCQKQNWNARKWGICLRHFLQAEEQGEVVLPMATRPHYASILNEDWDPLDFVGRSLILLLQSYLRGVSFANSLWLIEC